MSISLCTCLLPSTTPLSMGSWFFYRQVRESRHCRWPIDYHLKHDHQAEDALFSSLETRYFVNYENLDLHIWVESAVNLCSHPNLLAHSPCQKDEKAYALRSTSNKFLCSLFGTVVHMDC
jgi:hypothetical protein